MPSTRKTRLLAATSIAAIFFSVGAHATKWGYSGKTGPEHWGDLNAEFATCEKGMMQSPVDLELANAEGDVEFSVDWSTSALEVPPLGKAVQANFNQPSYMTSGGKVFKLVQVHFHTPSEHTFDGKTYPLVAHFVHAADDGALGVLGVLFEPGDANAELEKIIMAVNGGSQKGQQLDPNGLLPDEIEVYRYMGSLTTPPCSEGVHWHVAEDVISASSEQIEAMTKLMGNNARPVEPLHGRLLVEPE